MFLRFGRLLRKTGTEITALYFACRHPATPRAIKIAASLLAVYLISPIDLIPEAIPVLGLVDDVAIASFLIPLLLSRVPADALLHARARSTSVLRGLAFWR